MHQVAANPPLLAATLGAAVGVPTIAWWRGRFGGYAGLLQPSAALEVLQSEDAILVDMRCCPRSNMLSECAAFLRSAENHRPVVGMGRI